MNSPLAHQTVSTELRRSLDIYSLYRIALATILLLILVSQQLGKLDDAVNPRLFVLVSSMYFATTLATHWYARNREFHLRRTVLFIAYFLVDILALLLIAFANGGLSSGISVLLTVSVAAASIFFRGQLSLLIAAIATIALLLSTAWLWQSGSLKQNEVVSVGMMGILFFATAFIVQNLAERIEASQKIAVEKTRELAHSEVLNNVIVERMQTGILVINEALEVQSINRAAQQLLGVDAAVQQLPANLLKRFYQWRKAPHMQFKPFRVVKPGPHIQADFTRLQHDQFHGYGPAAANDAGDQDILIFLEDTGRTRQQAQQLKLASLGRLTASIAHEIRNPLGAISHAAQLLQESEALDSADQRLSDIVYQHAARMNRIIENVLQLSRRTSAKPEVIALDSWLQTFIEQLKQQYPQASIDVVLDAADMEIPFDPSQLDQVLTNLCSNGLRYSEQLTGQQTLHIRGHQHSAVDLPYIDIVDDGPGIAAAQLDQLFEPFNTSENSGTGLGLFIAKELCEANQARLDYISSDRGQSVFRLTFAHPERKLPALSA